MNCKVVAKSLEVSQEIDCSNSGLFMYSNNWKRRNNCYVPSQSKFTREVNSILSHYRSGSSKNSFQSGASSISSAKLLVSRSVLEQALLENKIILKYITRKKIKVNEFGVPIYNRAERAVYNIIEPYIAFRNPSMSRCKMDGGFFNRNFRVSKNSGDSFSLKAYDELAKMMGVDRSKKFPRFSISACNAFNFLGTYWYDVANLLYKNKKKIKDYKVEHLNAFKDISYKRYAYLVEDIEKLIESFLNKTAVCSDYTRRFMIFNLLHEEHYVACLLIVKNSTFLQAPLARELFIFDSGCRKNSYGNNLIKDLKRVLLKTYSIKYTYIAYGAQVEDSDKGYEVDNNCAFYSIRTMNALVRLIENCKESPLRARFFEDRQINCPDTEEEMQMYVQEMAKVLPEYFSYDSVNGAYRLKPYEARKLLHIGDRWITGNQRLREIASNF